jgi:thiamine biosynthesis lipoprotein
MEGFAMRQLWKKAIAVMLMVSLFLTIYGCGKRTDKHKFSSSFFDCFDTVITVYGYASDQTAFNQMVALVHENFLELHEKFDAYHEYEDVINVYTLNQNAGGEPVAVSTELYELIKQSKQLYMQTGGKVNVAMGSVLQVWETYREMATKDPDGATVPDSKILNMAAQHMDINNVVMDDPTQSIVLTDPYMSLNVGAVAKGYACEIVKDRMIDAGYNSFVISAGGNVVTVGQDIARDAAWGVGIQNPDTQTADEIIDTIYASDKAIVTAGSYQRYFTVNGKRYHHIIDPATLMPAINFDSVTVICDDSLLADFMATTLFILPPGQAMALAESIDGLDAVWVDTKGEISYTSGYTDYSKTY